MTEPRLHLLARRAVAAIALGKDPTESVLAALVDATKRQPWPAIIDQMPRRSRAVCVALWGEPPMRTADVHRVIGGSYHSVHELLGRLLVARFVRRTGFARYTLQYPSQMPRTLPRLSVIRSTRRHHAA